jgi:hypothetical protein
MAFLAHAGANPPNNRPADEPSVLFKNNATVFRLQKDASGKISREIKFDSRMLDLNAGPNMHLRQQIIEAILPDAPGNIDSKLFYKLKNSDNNNPIKILIYLKTQADLTNMKSASKKDKYREVISRLKGVADYTQKDILMYLESQKSKGQVKNYKSFWISNIISAEVSRSSIDELLKFYSVAKIYENKVIEPPKPVKKTDQKVVFDKHNLTWGLAKVKVTQIWDQGYHGEGMIIGSIDTGVDVDHPSIANKMANIGNGNPGWVDFNTYSSEPIDDIGHGTHTIGTMVGDNNNSMGINIGVAPGAKYYAARVFGPNPAYDDNFIMAGQWMLDPDNNPGTNDAPDIINNSWGSVYMCSSDPWYRSMVQAWRAAGILPVFAAGNGTSWPDPFYMSGYDGYWTASDPGNYPESFSVGATNPDDIVSDFSRKGPATYDGVEGIVKPDIVAPGEQVISAWASGTDMYGDGQHSVGSDLYWSNGTSMAAPHVAGAAALLMQMHPNWTIDDIQAALMQKSDNLGKDVYTQGAGRLDVIQAANASFVTLPSTLSFGRDNVDLATWQSTRTLLVKNISSSTLGLDLSVEDTNSQGTIYDIQPNHIDLSVNAAASVSVSVNVDNNAAPNINSYPNAHIAELAMQSNQTLVSMPLAFLKSPRIYIKRIGADPEFFEIDDKGSFWDSWPGAIASFYYNLPHEGNYNTFSYFYEPLGGGPPLERGYCVIKENKAVGLHPTRVDVNKNDAIYQMNMNPVDCKGLPLITNYKYNCFQSKPLSTGQIAGLCWNLVGFETQASIIDFRFSSVIDSYDFLWKYFTWYNPGDPYQMPIDFYYSISGGLFEGIHQDLNWQNNPSDFEKIKVRFSKMDDTSSLDVFGRSVAYPYIDYLYIMPAPKVQYPFYERGISVYNQNGKPLYTTPDFIVDPQRYLEVVESYSMDPLYTVTDDFWTTGIAPITGYLFLSPGGFLGHKFLSQGYDTLVPETFYDGWGFEMGSGYCEIYKDGELTYQGYIPRVLLKIYEPGFYVLKIPGYHTYDIKGQEGIATTFLEFTLSEASVIPTPPSFNKPIQILSDGQVTNIVASQAQTNEIKFSLNDSDEISNVSAAYSTVDGTFQGQFSLACNGNEIDGVIYKECTAAIPPNFHNKDTYLNMEILASDIKGNIVRQKLEPAFFYDCFSDYVCGDADGSGQVDVSDIVYLINYIFGSGSAPYPLAVGDADGSCQVDVSDIVYLINYIFGSGPAPICPSCKSTQLSLNPKQGFTLETFKLKYQDQAKYPQLFKPLVQPAQAIPTKAPAVGMSK